MNFRSMMMLAVAAVMLSATVAEAGLFNRGNDCCEPVCCDPCCDEGGFLSRLRNRGGDDCCCEVETCCEPVCCEPEPCCAPEPTCCEPEPCCAAPEPACAECEVAAEPACGCEAEPACGCEVETCCEPAPCCEPEPCCDPCCDEDKGCFLQRLRDRRSKDDCCAPSCGC